MHNNNNNNNIIIIIIIIIVRIEEIPILSSPRPKHGNPTQRTKPQTSHWPIRRG